MSSSEVLGLAWMTRARHDLVLVGSLDFDLAQVGDIAFDGDGGTGLAIDGHFGEVGEDDDEGGGVFEGYLIAELALDDGYRVEGGTAIEVADV